MKDTIKDIIIGVLSVLLIVVIALYIITLQAAKVKQPINARYLHITFSNDCKSYNDTVDMYNLSNIIEDDTDLYIYYVFEDKAYRKSTYNNKLYRSEIEDNTNLQDIPENKWMRLDGWELYVDNNLE